MAQTTYGIFAAYHKNAIVERNAWDLFAIPKNDKILIWIAAPQHFEKEYVKMQFCDQVYHIKLINKPIAIIIQVVPLTVQ